MTHTLDPPSAQPMARMFDRICRGYDIANRLLTLGLDQRWRRRAARLALASNPGKILDACCGTADMAVLLARLAPSASAIWAADFSAAMLELARRKAESKGVGNRIQFVRADIARAPFPDGFFDAITIGFAFRNLTWRNPRRDENLAGLRRLLRPGGRLVVIETSQPPRLWLRKAFHAYQRQVVARLGGVVGGDRGAYSYLANSAVGFFPAPEVCRMLERAGFASARHRLLTAGVVALVEAAA